MMGLSGFDLLFATASFLIQAVLAVSFALRKWKYGSAIRFGWIVCALAVPAAGVSLVLLLASRPWYQWLAGLLFSAWAGYGYWIDIARPRA
jgi:hypothetical protein